MNRRLIVICAVAFLVALAVPAFAAVQNVKVSGDITASIVDRVDFNLGRAAANTHADSNVFMSQVRLRVDADLTDNVSTTLRLINERDWGTEAGIDSTGSSTSRNSTEVDVDLAYVTLKEMLYSPLTVIIGRQNLWYGNGMIIGDPDTSRLETSNAPGIRNRDLSLRKSFDAVRAILNYDPLTIDLVMSKIAENRKVATSALRDKNDQNLYGINASYKLGDKYNSMVEGYWFQRRNDATKVDQNNTAEVVNAPGLRISSSPVKGLYMSLEQAWQIGDKNMAAGKNRTREAMATQFISTYALQIDKLAKYSPMVGIGFSRFSGDKNPADGTSSSDSSGKYKAWDPMFNDQGVGTIANVLFDKTNSRVLNINASAKPIEDVTLRLDWSSIWLDRKLNINKWGNGSANLFSLFQPDGDSNLTPTMNASQQHLGNEIDATLTYDYTEDVQFKLLGGWFNPGMAFNKTASAAKSAKELIASCKVVF